MLNTLIVLLFVNLALAAPRQLVPYINTLGKDGLDSTGFQLEPFDDRYSLTIHQDKAQRDEVVQEIAPGELLFAGRQTVAFKDYGYIEIIYEAGRNGYVAKYKFTADQILITPQFLPASVLKAAAG